MTTQPLKLALSKPLMFTGREITELHLREPVAKDIREMPAGSLTIGDFITVLEKLAGLPPAGLDDIAAADAIGAIELVAPFLRRFPSTGSTS